MLQTRVVAFMMSTRNSLLQCEQRIFPFQMNILKNELYEKYQSWSNYLLSKRYSNEHKLSAANETEPANIARSK